MSRSLIPPSAPLEEKSEGDLDLGDALDDASRTRLRTVAPSVPPSERLFDRQLREAEEASGERAREIIVRVGGVVGGDPALLVMLAVAPEGPDTPAEDLWSDPIVLADLPVASADSVRERVRWALQASKEHRLLPARIEEVWTFGAHGYRGDPDAITLFLDARLRRVTLSLSESLLRCTYAELDGPNGRELVVTAELAAPDARERPIVCELLRQPRAECDLVLSAADWTSRQTSA